MGAVAAGVLTMNDHVEDSDDTHDEYDELLTALGRSYDEDVRISLHESGHCIAQLLFGEPVGFVTVNPADGYEGCVRGEWGIRGFVKEGGKVLDAGDVRAVLAPCMPLPGEDRAKVSEYFPPCMRNASNTHPAKSPSGCCLTANLRSPATIFDKRASWQR
jgi:hypothetical protein